MSAFEPALAVVLAHEGGWSDHPDDQGGPTKYGITLATFRDWAGHHRTTDDLRAMSREDAAAIYGALFWCRYGYGRIDDQRCATKLFDAAVNVGPRRAHVLAQRVAGIIEDGVLGPITIGMINAARPDVWLRLYSEELLGWYEAIVAAKPRQSVFMAGWRKRAAWPEEGSA